MKTSPVEHLRWNDISSEDREALSGKLVGMWEKPSDEEAFEVLSVAAQQSLFLILSRLRAKDLWPLVIGISNVWGEGGVGLEFTASPMLESTLPRRKDFTTLFANHRNTDGGFYEKGRARSVLHFLYVDGTPRKWSLHFDLYNPIHSPVGAWLHLRHEVFSKVKPDWRMIQQGLKA
ncbi:MAG: hypothetical protein H7Z16_05240 [Pyrinomonadaceae bacterium]|nr:hypothetical protein [Pyrinomonadaceae bacterium]